RRMPGTARRRRLLLVALAAHLRAMLARAITARAAAKAAHRRARRTMLVAIPTTPATSPLLPTMTASSLVVLASRPRTTSSAPTKRVRSRWRSQPSRKSS
ncbi:hypothetical protein LTR53_019711, partial [Teratosphaeriaceae sp. CCFEE 6253]